MQGMKKCLFDMMKLKEKGRLRGDIILIAALLAAAVVCLLCLPLLRGDGDVVMVTVDGKPYGTYLLSQDMTEDILTGDGKLNRLVIRGGEAHVERATCPDGICAAHRAIHCNGESIVCLPHRVVITVVSADTDAPDAVA